MTDDRFKRMREVYAEAVAIAPALRARFEAAGLSAGDLRAADDLNRLPVLKKERLMELQQLDPPFAGFLALRPEEIGHIYVSPGPIFEPLLASDASGHGMDLMFGAAGIGPGDLVLNTWFYHLVPAGLLFDHGARAVGATVIPGGTGASELQADIYPAHLQNLVQQIAGIERAALSISRAGNRDEITALVVAVAGSDMQSIEGQLREVFSRLTRLRLDRVKYVGAQEIRDQPIADHRHTA